MGEDQKIHTQVVVVQQGIHTLYYTIPPDASVSVPYTGFQR